jgi:hypothetical protein
MLNDESQAIFSFPSSLLSEPSFQEVKSDSVKPITNLDNNKIIESIVDNFVSAPDDSNILFWLRSFICSCSKSSYDSIEYQTPENHNYRALICTIRNIEEILNCFDQNESILWAQIKLNEEHSEEEIWTRSLHRYHLRQVYHYLGLVHQIKQIEIVERIQEYLWEHNNT